MNSNRGHAQSLKACALGFSLLEVVIAIAVISVTFIGLIGLLGLGVVTDQTSSQQASATNIAASILADLRSTPTYSNTGKSTRYGMTLPTAAPASSATPLSGFTAGTTAAPMLYFDNSPAFISLNPASVPANAVYVANVYMTRLGTIGPTTTPPSIQSNDMVRVVVSWPAQTPAGTAPAGSVDVISQFLIH